MVPAARLGLLAFLLLPACATVREAPRDEDRSTTFLVRCQDKAKCGDDAREECGGQFEYVGEPTRSDGVDGAVTWEMLVTCK